MGDLVLLLICFLSVLCGSTEKGEIPSPLFALTTCSCCPHPQGPAWHENRRVVPAPHLQQHLGEQVMHLSWAAR